MTIVESTPTPYLPADSEVTVTVTGRVVATGGGPLVVEYLNSQGFPDRFAVDTGSAAVTVEPAPGPSAAEVARRVDVHRRIASAALDLDDAVRAAGSVPYGAGLVDTVDEITGGAR